MTVNERAAALLQRLERFEHAGARALLGLAASMPDPLLATLTRAIDGARPHPEVQLLLALRRLTGSHGLAAHSPTLAAARARMRRDARVHGGLPLRVGSVRELTFEGARCALKARHYAPPPSELAPPRPLLVFFHGGGFALGDLDTHDLPCRALCRELDVHVLSVEYRLAPEHPFPAGLDDARAALRFAWTHAAQLGADPARVAVAGDSAGANLAAVVTQLAVRAGDPAPIAQLLIYPTVDSSKDWPSMEQFADGFFLTRADIYWFRERYLGKHTDPADPRVSPLLATDLSRLPPALIISAGFDPLRDEGEAYAAALRAAGATAVLHRVPDLIHGFIHLGALSRAANSALQRVTGLARAMLDAPSSQ